MSWLLRYRVAEFVICFIVIAISYGASVAGVHQRMQKLKYIVVIKMITIVI